MKKINTDNNHAPQYVINNLCISEPRESLKKILSNLIQTQGLSDNKKLYLLNGLVKLLSSVIPNENSSDIFGFSTYDIMCW